MALASSASARGSARRRLIGKALGKGRSFDSHDQDKKVDQGAVDEDDIGCAGSLMIKSSLHR
jgi:hypothetical protein